MHTSPLAGAQSWLSPTQGFTSAFLNTEASVALPVADDPEIPWEAFEADDSPSIPSAETPKSKRRPLIFNDDEDGYDPSEPFCSPLPSVHVNTECSDTQAAAAKTPVPPALETITLTKVIVSPEEATAEELNLPESLLKVDDAALLKFGISAVLGFRTSRLNKARILAEAKSRYSEGGASGRRPNGVMSWHGYCEAIGEPLSTANALVSRLDTFRKMNPALQEAALAAGVDVVKPKVQQVLCLLQEEMWSGDSDSIEAGVARLQAAEGRVATPPASPAPPSAPYSSPNPPLPETRKASLSRPGAGLGGPGPKLIQFTSGELRRADETLAKIRSFAGWDNATIKEPELYLQGLDALVEKLEVKHAHADLG